jgi:hypothetical protein
LISLAARVGELFGDAGDLGAGVPAGFLDTSTVQRPAIIVGLGALPRRLVWLGSCWRHPPLTST